MKQKNYDYILGFIVALMLLSVTIIQAYDSIDYLIANWEFHSYYGNTHILAVYSITAIASIALGIYLILFIIYNFIRRNAEIAYRGPLIGLGAHSIIAGLIQVITVIINFSKDNGFNPTSDIIQGLLVVLTGGGLIYAAVTKLAAKGRSMALSMSMILCVLYVISIVSFAAQTKTFGLPQVEQTILLIAFLVMSVIAYRRKTFVLYY